MTEETKYKNDLLDYERIKKIRSAMIRIGAKESELVKLPIKPTICENSHTHQ